MTNTQHCASSGVKKMPSWWAYTWVLLGLMAPGAQAANTYTSTGTFTANITAGTCTVTATDNGGAAITVLDMGDIYISELKAKAHAIPFKLKFSNCLGVSTITVSNTQGGCSGSSSQDDTFGNTLSGAGNASGVGLEIWMGATDGNGLLHCHAPEKNAGNVLALGAGPVVVDTTKTQDMNARMVAASGETSGVVAGMFNTTVNFTFTYE